MRIDVRTFEGEATDTLTEFLLVMLQLLAQESISTYRLAS